MRQLITVLFVGLLGVATLPACTTDGGLKKPTPMAEIKVPSTLSEAGQEAQKLINEANALYIAAYKTIESNVVSDLLDPKVALGYLDELDRQAFFVDQAQFALDAGRDGDALSQSKLLKAAIQAIQKKAADKAKEAK